MKFKSLLAGGLALAVLAPTLASASPWRDHRRDQASTWRDLAIGAGIVGVIGALSHNDTLAVAGAAGAAYATYRYEDECWDGHAWYHIYEGRRIYDYDYHPRGDWDRRRDDRNWDRGSIRSRDSREYRSSDNRGRDGRKDNRDLGRGGRF